MPDFVRASLRVYDRLARAIAPRSGPTQRNYLNRLRDLVQPDSDWLDLGCGHQLFPAWLSADESELTQRAHRVAGIDLDFPSLQKNHTLRDRVLGNLQQIPFRSGAFNLVTANMVVEHVADPELLLREVHRILRPGGRFLFHTPNFHSPAIRVAALTPDGLKKRIIWMLERRAEEDVFPTHYRINTGAAIHALAQTTGFSVAEMHFLNNAAATAVLGPLAIPELLMIRALHAEGLRGWRSNLLVVLQK